MAYKPNGKINIQNNVSTPSTVNKDSTDMYTTIYLTERPEYFEPQRSNTFKFVVNNLNVDVSDFGVGTYPLNNEEEALELAVKASSVPNFDISKLTINRGNGQMHFAGKPEFKDGQLQVHDYIGAYTKDILLAWQRLAYNVKTQKVGLAKDYKREAILYELTPDYQIVREWSLHGCWISGLSEDNYDHDSADNRLITATVVYDYAEPKLYNPTQG